MMSAPGPLDLFWRVPPQRLRNETAPGSLTTGRRGPRAPNVGCCLGLNPTLFFLLSMVYRLTCSAMERSRLLAVLYGRKSAASGQWCTVLGSGVRGQDPSGGGVLGGVVLLWVGRIRAGVGYGSWQWGVRGQGPSSVGGVLGGGVHGQSPSRLVVVGRVRVRRVR